VDGVFSYGCVCAAGYSGFNCADDINECLSSPCLNGGACAESGFSANVRVSGGVGSKVSMSLDADYLKSLGSKDALSDGVLTTQELMADPQGAMLLKAMQEQIASELGVSATLVSIQGLRNTGRRVQATSRVNVDFFAHSAAVAADKYQCICRLGLRDRTARWTSMNARLRRVYTAVLASRD